MAEITWANAVNGSFNDAADWTGGVAPGASDDAILDAPGADFRVGTSVSETVNSVQTAANATLAIGGGTFTATYGTGSGVNDGTLSLSNSAKFDTGGTFVNAGTIILTNLCQIVTEGQGLTVSGGGILTFNGGTISVVTGAAFTNVDNTVVGFFSLQSDAITNGTNGIIDASSSEASLISIPGDNPVTNAGLMEATSGGELDFGTLVLENEGGTVSAGNGSTVDLTFCFDVVGGTLISSGTGEIVAGGYIANHFKPNAFDGRSSAIYNDAAVVIPDEQNLFIEGTVVNSGSFSLGSTNDATFLNVGSGGATLSGGGDIFLGDNAHNYMRSAVSTHQVLTDVDNTISGGGSIGLGTLGFIIDAAAVIDATGTNSALVIETEGETFDNFGLVEGTGKKGLMIRSSTVANSGTIFAGTGSSVTLQGADIQGGTLASAGTGVIKAIGGGNVLDGSSAAVDITGELLDATAALITGEGTINLSGKFVNKGAVTLTGPLDNTGTLESGGGALTVEGPVTGTGDVVFVGGWITFDSSFSQKVVFDGGGNLILADSQGYSGTLWKFSTTGLDTLDLEDIAFGGTTTATYSGTTSGGVLTVTNGTETASIAMKGDYLGTTFTLSEDADGGTIVTDKVDTPAVATFAQAIAGFAPTPTASASAIRLAEHNAPVMLSRPGTSVA